MGKRDPTLPIPPPEEQSMILDAPVLTKEITVKEELAVDVSHECSDDSETLSPRRSSRKIKKTSRILGRDRKRLSFNEEDDSPLRETPPRRAKAIEDDTRRRRASGAPDEGEEVRRRPDRTEGYQGRTERLTPTRSPAQCPAASHPSNVLRAVWLVSSRGPPYEPLCGANDDQASKATTRTIDRYKRKRKMSRKMRESIYGEDDDETPLSSPIAKSSPNKAELDQDQDGELQKFFDENVEADDPYAHLLDNVGPGWESNASDGEDIVVIGEQKPAPIFGSGQRIRDRRDSTNALKRVTQSIESRELNGDYWKPVATSREERARPSEDESEQDEEEAAQIRRKIPFRYMLDEELPYKMEEEMPRKKRMHILKSASGIRPHWSSSVITSAFGKMGLDDSSRNSVKNVLKAVDQMHRWRSTSGEEPKDVLDDLTRPAPFPGRQ
ncbi:unnamed protein product, partial [Mesorhabditis spiculigera]